MEKTEAFGKTKSSPRPLNLGKPMYSLRAGKLILLKLKSIKTVVSASLGKELEVVTLLDYLTV